MMFDMCARIRKMRNFSLVESAIGTIQTTYMYAHNMQINSKLFSMQIKIYRIFIYWNRCVNLHLKSIRVLSVANNTYTVIVLQ